MILVGDHVVCSVADLAAVARCEFAVLRRLDTILGLVAPVPDPFSDRAPEELSDDAMSDDAMSDDVMSDDVIDQLAEDAGCADWVRIPPPDLADTTGAALIKAHDQTVTALRSGTGLVVAPQFFEGAFLAGCAAVTLDTDGPVLYSAAPVHARVTALIELAACAQALGGNGFAGQSRVQWLAGGQLQLTATAAAVYSAHHRRLNHILDIKHAELLPVQWGDQRFLACGRCPSCVAEATAHRDITLLPDIRPTIRARLRTAGTTTLDRLASTDAAVSDGTALAATTGTALAKVPAHTLSLLCRQARLLLQHLHEGASEYRLADATALAALPASAAGDVFVAVCQGSVFAAVCHDGTGLAALGTVPIACLPQLLIEHRRNYPDRRIYHYRSGIRALLAELPTLPQIDDEAADELLAAIVDLHPILRSALGEASCTVGEEPPGELAAECARVLRLRNRLQELSRGLQVAPAVLDGVAAEPVSAVAAALRELAAQATGESAEIAARMAALLGWHRHRRRAVRWAHTDRLAQPLDQWSDAPGVLVADHVSVDTTWRGPGRPLRRYLTLTGRLGAGDTPAPGTAVRTVYDHAEPGMTSEPGGRATTTATVLGCALDADFDDTVRVEEALPAGSPPYEQLPVALVPALPCRAESIAATVESMAQKLLASLPEVPATAAFDLLCRRRPRLRGGGDLPPVCGDHAAAITAAVADLDRSYVAVQGPSGTGRTDTVARVIQRLVARDHWRVGVVGPSHRAVEQLLDAVVRVGVLPELVATSNVQSVAPEWLSITTHRYARFLDSALNGCVLGAMARDFADPALVPHGAVDLLVIADAGEFALADTVAVAAGVRNLLLLGDIPASDSYEGEMVDRTADSALGWLVGESATLPPEFGYFLDRTWRLHPQLCEAVAALRYGGRLRSTETVTLARELDGVPAGLLAVPVEHRGNSIESVAEAREIVRRVKAMLGRAWRQGAVARPLHEHDILVVAAHRAQAALIASMLARSRLDDVLVGTLDRLRGREAAVVLVSMTASTPQDAPTGVTALLSRHWLTSAIGRAMWAAVIVYSPLLTTYLPERPEQLADLAAFLELTS